jgi:hypothetical protein
VTDLEKRAIVALRSVKFPEKSWHGKRAETLNARLALWPDMRLGFDLSSDLWFLVWRYRRQITDLGVVAHADEVVNGALHLEFEISL